MEHTFITLENTKQMLVSRGFHNVPKRVTKKGSYLGRTVGSNVDRFILTSKFVR